MSETIHVFFPQQELNEKLFIFIFYKPGVWSRITCTLLGVMRLLTIKKLFVSG
jgi:hypothetical protein